MTARRDDDPLAGATIVVHDLSRPDGLPRGATGTPAPPPATAPAVPPSPNRWVAAARYGLVAVSFTLFGVFGALTWLGRAPVTPTFGTLVAPPKVEIRVHVDGAVLHPGVYRLAQGDRVEDAIKAAGGPAPHADQSKLILSQRVRDEQRLDVPALPAAPLSAATEREGPSSPDELSSATSAQVASDPSSASGSGQPAPTTSGPSQGATAPRPTSIPRPQATPRPTSAPRAQSTPRATAFSGGRVNVNTATQAQLEQLPGFGATSAQRILAFRTANGPLRSLDDIRKAGVREQFVRLAADYLAFE